MAREMIDRMFEAVEQNDIDSYVQYFTDDAEYKAGNLPPVYGPDSIRQFGASMIPMFNKVSHKVNRIYEFGDTYVCEMELTYDRKDGKSFTVPCLDIIRTDGNGKVKSLRAYVDATPAFS